MRVELNDKKQIVDAMGHSELKFSLREVVSYMVEDYDEAITTKYNVLFSLMKLFRVCHLANPSFYLDDGLRTQLAGQIDLIRTQLAGQKNPGATPEGWSL